MTLYNLFTKAFEPGSIRVRILQQNDPEVDSDCLEGYCALLAEEKAKMDAREEEEVERLMEEAKRHINPESCPHSDRVYVHQVHAKEAKGPTWARGLLSKDMAEAYGRGDVSPQDHCMSIDSHMDFEPLWDKSMADMWDAVQNE